MSFKFSVVSFSSIKPREQLDTRYLHGSLISFELEKKEKNQGECDVCKTQFVLLFKKPCL